MGRVQRCIDAGIIEGDQTDIAYGLYALAQGLAMQEAAGWLGSSRTSVTGGGTGRQRLPRRPQPPTPGHSAARQNAP